MCSCLRGVSRWFTPLDCGPGYPELSKSYMDMASKLFTFIIYIEARLRPLRSVAAIISHVTVAVVARIPCSQACKGWLCAAMPVIVLI